MKMLGRVFLLCVVFMQTSAMGATNMQPKSNIPVHPILAHNCKGKDWKVIHSAWELSDTYLLFKKDIDFIPFVFGYTMDHLELSPKPVVPTSYTDLFSKDWEKLAANKAVHNWARYHQIETQNSTQDVGHFQLGVRAIYTILPNYDDDDDKLKEMTWETFLKENRQHMELWYAVHLDTVLNDIYHLKVDCKVNGKAAFQLLCDFLNSFEITDTYLQQPLMTQGLLDTVGLYRAITSKVKMSAVAKEYALNCNDRLEWEMELGEWFPQHAKAWPQDEFDQAIKQALYSREVAVYSNSYNDYLNLLKAYFGVLISFSWYDLERIQRSVQKGRISSHVYLQYAQDEIGHTVLDSLEALTLLWRFPKRTFDEQSLSMVTGDMNDLYATGVVDFINIPAAKLRYNVQGRLKRQILLDLDVSCSDSTEYCMIRTPKADWMFSVYSATEQKGYVVMMKREDEVWRSQKWSVNKGYDLSALQEISPNHYISLFQDNVLLAVVDSALILESFNVFDGWHNTSRFVVDVKSNSDLLLFSKYQFLDAKYAIPKMPIEQGNETVNINTHEIFIDYASPNHENVVYKHAQVGDLNADGKIDIWAYAIKDGQVDYVRFWTLENHTLVERKGQDAIDALKMDVLYYNLLLYSELGK